MGSGKRLICGLTALFVALLMTMAACGGSSHSNSNTGSNGGGATTGSSNPGNTGGGGSGSGGGGSSSGASAHFAYVVDSAGSSISGFKQDSNTGALTPLSGTPFKGAAQSDGAAVLGNVLYVTQSLSATPGIVSFGINSDGSLSRLVTTAMVSSNNEEISHGLWTAGSQCLYGASNQGGVWGWKAGNGGTLTNVPNSAQSLGPNLSIAVSPNGKWLFATFEQISGGGTFETDTYAIDGNSCGLTRTGLASTLGIMQSNSPGKAPTWMNMTVDANSKYLFYADSWDGRVLTQSIGSDGSLAVAPGSPISTGGSPFSLVATANYLYVGDFGGALIYGFTIGSNGTLTPMSGSPFKNDMAPAYSLNVDPSGKFLYAIDNDPGGIAIFSIGSSGALTQISGSPVTSGGVSTSSPLWMAIK